ncbi:MAG: hypothetical protein IJC21_06920, partial [Lentisphaeria bacterium]|nr:hypothetical protein [Lentisphaeria bacterium]
MLFQLQTEKSRLKQVCSGLFILPGASEKESIPKHLKAFHQRKDKRICQPWKNVVISSLPDTPAAVKP